MRISPSILLILFLLPLVSNAQKTASLPPGLDKYIQQVISTFDVPGVSVSIVKDGKVLLAKGYGVKKTGGKDPVDGNTLFSIASNSKAFTTTALAMLVEEGKLKWDDRVIQYLPWFSMSDSYVSTHLTVRDLLVHQSGLLSYSGDLMLFPPSAYSRREILEKLPKLPLVHDFRTTYAYDNILYLAAGEIIKSLSGMEWEDFIKTRIFDQAGMPGSISRYSQFAKQTNISAAHDRINGTVQSLDMNLNIGDASDPAGGILSNANDMANWMITQLDSGRTPAHKVLFKPATTKELWKMVRPIPVSRIAKGFEPAQMDYFGYALGFRTYNYQRYKVVGHGGKLNGFVSQVAMVPDLNLGITVLTNQEMAAAYWAIIYHVLDYYEKNKPYDWINSYKEEEDRDRAKNATELSRNTVKADSTAKFYLPLSQLTGNYQDEVYGDVSLTAAGQGMVMEFKQLPYLIADLKYFQYNTFIATFRNKGLKADAYVSFALNPNGTPDQVKLKIIDPDSDITFYDVVLRKKVDAGQKPASHHLYKPVDTADLHKSISAEFARQPTGVFALAVKDLGTGQEFFINAHESYHAASTMKTPVLIETYQQAAAGKFKITDSVMVTNTFKSIVDGSPYSLDSVMDSEHELYNRVGTKLPISDLLFRMITRSSNLATNNVIDLVGAKNVNRTMRSYGIRKMEVLRGVEDTKAFNAGLNNTTTAYDLMLVFERLAKGTAVNKASSEAMIAILLQQHFSNKIAGKLPKDVKVANKTGSIAGVMHDSGIVFLPDGRKYVIVMLSRGISSEDAAAETLANVSKLVYDHIVAKKTN